MESEPLRLLARSLRGQALLLGIDRLDPTKGLPERLEAFRRVICPAPGPRSATMLQIAAPSREDVLAYRKLRQEVDSAAGAINGEFGEPDWMPLRLLARPQSRDTRGGLHAAGAGRRGDAAARRHEPGRQGIHRRAGPGRSGRAGAVALRRRGAQLDSALLVNPHDAEGMAEALHRALDMPLAERQERWQAAWEAIAGASPEGWGEAFLRSLAPENLVNLPVAGSA